MRLESKGLPPGSYRSEKTVGFAAGPKWLGGTRKVSVCLVKRGGCKCVVPVDCISKGNMMKCKVSTEGRRWNRSLFIELVSWCR